MIAPPQPATTRSVIRWNACPQHRSSGQSAPRSMQSMRSIGSRPPTRPQVTSACLTGYDAGGRRKWTEGRASTLVSTRLGMGIIAIDGRSDNHVTAYAMTVLLPDVEDAQRLAAALDDVRRPDGPLAVIAVPPVRGLAFFADGDRQAKIDRWWAHAIPQHTVPIHLLQH